MVRCFGGSVVFTTRPRLRQHDGGPGALRGLESQVKHQG